jgi:hypothetical protein
VVEYLTLVCAAVAGALGIAVMIRCGRRYAAACALLIVGCWGWVNVEVMAMLVPKAMRVEADIREIFQLVAWVGMAAMLARMVWRKTR